MNIRFPLLIFIAVPFFIFASESKTFDPYKILGIEKNASQREIQKSFHRLSLQYHPDKNKKKGAQEKFAEINNAYEILSDEEKRKNYDLYGDEKGSSGFDSGAHSGSTRFTSGGHGNHRFTFRPEDWVERDGRQQSESFSFSFGGPGREGSSGFGLNDIFSNFFMGSENNDVHFSKDQPQSKSSKRMRAINRQIYEKEIDGQGMTWLLLSFIGKLKQNQQYESIIEDVERSLEGILKVGSINCENEQSFCKSLGIYPTNSPRVFLYKRRDCEHGLMIEYSGDLALKSLKIFCKSHLPNLSKRVDFDRFDFTSSASKSSGLPRLMLLSTKKDTPVIWRALSGLFCKRFVFYDAQVSSVSNPSVEKLGIVALPAIIGWLRDEKINILKTGISVKDLKSGVHDLTILLEGFEKKCKESSKHDKKTESAIHNIPLLTSSNFHDLCPETTPLCIIGVFKNSKWRQNLESILLQVSQKALSRGISNARKSISYSLLDATKHSGILYAFDKSGYKSLDMLLIAYKPRKEKFAVYMDGVSVKEAEVFVTSVLNGDVPFKKTQQKPFITFD